MILVMKPDSLSRTGIRSTLRPGKLQIDHRGFDPDVGGLDIHIDVGRPYLDVDDRLRNIHVHHGRRRQRPRRLLPRE